MVKASQALRALPPNCSSIIPLRKLRIKRYDANVATSKAIGSIFAKRFYTRSQAAKACGISLQAWHNVEARGVVVPVPVAEARGWTPRPGAGKQPKFVIRAADVARVKDDTHVQRRTFGQISAAAFAEFDAGQKPADVVVRLKLAPKQVEDLHETWRRMRGCVVLPFTCVETMQRFGFAVDNEQTFVDAVTRLLEAARAGFARSKR